MKAVIYLMQDGGRFKIGCSVHPGRRVRELSWVKEAKAVLIHVMESDDPWYWEAALHCRLSEYALAHEWFRLPLRVVRWLKGKKNTNELSIQKALL